MFDDHEIRIPKASDPSGYDLFQTGSGNPSSATRLPNPTMSIFRVPKYKAKPKAPKAPGLGPKGEAGTKKALARALAQPSTTASRPTAASPRDSDSQSRTDLATAQLERSLDKLAANKRDKSYGSQLASAGGTGTNEDTSTTVVTGLPSSKGAKVKPTGKRLLEPQAAASPRSLPPSPALTASGSPSFASSGGTAQERLKQQRFPILHELAVQELSREELLAKWREGTEEEFDAALGKVADLDKDSQKWALKKMFWKELDVFEYNYADKEQRQRAISNAIKQYDRSRLGTSDALWQKLLPKSDRGKGICLSRLQAAIAKGPPPQAPKPKVDAANASGAESDSGSMASRKGKGGESMSRSSSQASTGKKKLSASEAQAKRMLSTSKKPTAAVTDLKPPLKPLPAKPAAKGASTKGGRVLSKEFVSDSSSSGDEVPLSTSIGKAKAGGSSASKPTPRVREKPRPAEKTKEVALAKPKAAAAAKALLKEDRKEKERPMEKEMDTIRAQVIAKPAKPPTKRLREPDDDDSSSSGTPLSKRVKPPLKPLPAPSTSGRARTASDASHNSRGPGPGAAASKPKTASPVKSSPLAASPPTNASDMEPDRHVQTKVREREREREREVTAVRNSNTTVTSNSSSHSSHSHTDSGASSTIAKTTTTTARKRPPPTAEPPLASGMERNGHGHGSRPAVKRPRPSPETIEMAARFKQFYARYEQLHHDVSRLDNPDPGKVTDLLDMHERLSRMKTEIYAAVEAC